MLTIINKFNYLFTIGFQQSELPKPEGSSSETYKPDEFTEFFQDNWVYLAILLVIVYIVIMYSKILKERKRKNN